MALEQILIITNNPMVKNMDNAEICFIQGDCRQVLYQVLNKVADGHSLLSHPLAGSIKPEENPYRSIVLSASKSDADLSTLAMLEKCLGKVEAGFKDSIKTEHLKLWTQDFQMIDKELVNSALQSLTER
jgi:hypothetical protein